MSDAVFPLLPGLAWSVMRTPQWSTNVTASKSGRQYAVGDRLYPTYKWKLPYEFMRAYGSFAEQQQLFGFINSLRGRGDSFLYRDPNDYAVTALQLLGYGDGVTTRFPLVRAFGAFVEPVIAADTLSHVTVNGADVPYGDGPGRFLVEAGAPNVATLIFGTPPSAGQGVQWAGTFYWRCRLLSDAITFEQFLSGFWKTDIEFESFRP